MTNILETINGRKVGIYRTTTANGSLSSTQYLPMSKMQFGVDATTPSEGSTSLNKAIPIQDGTVLDDGSNTLTGSSGADNSTDNTTTYKDGAGTSDVTAQNLLADGTGTNVLKVWTISALTTNAAADQYTGLWLYIKDATALAKLETSGTAVEIKLGSDTSNYYSKTYTASQLATGWNWLSLGVLNTLTETGTVSGNIDTFVIEVTTNNATDEFAAGDLVYDLLRQWELADTLEAFLTGYPTVNITELSSTVISLLTTIEANGFLIDNVALWNEDTTPLMGTVAKLSEGESKSSTDEFRFTIKRRAV